MPLEHSADPAAFGESAPAVFSSRGKYVFIFLCALLIYVAKSAGLIDAIFNRLDLHDNDDMMRLLSVRDWLAGQSWFDMTQYRAIPGEGVSLHWSRYVDAALGGLITLLVPFADPALAERLAVIVWPAILFFFFLLVSGQFARSLFGLQAASFTLMAVATIPAIGAYFMIGRIDHHNVQMLSMLVIAAAIASNASPFKMGALAGVVAAFSLAIGLESLIYVGGAGLVVVAFYIVLGGDERHRLLGYGLGLGLAAPLFFIGQTARDDWFLTVCDKLSPPVLAVAGIAGAYSVVVYLLGRSDRTFVRMGLALLVGGGALALMFPHAQACSAGPYGSLPENLRDAAMGMIAETTPIQVVAQRNPPLAVALALPAFVTLATGLAAFWGSRRVKGLQSELRSFSVLLVFLAAATLGLFYQLRLVVSVYAVQPLVFGVTVSWLWKRHAGFSGALRPLLIVATIITTLLAYPIAGATYFARSVIAATPGGQARLMPGYFDQDCKSSEVLRQLNAISPATILSSVNIGTRLLLHTHHHALAVPYHRSTAAIRHGFETFLLGSDAFEEAVRAAGAEYVLVCRGNRYGNGSAAQDLAHGNTPVWLSLVPLGETPMMLYRVHSAQDPSG